MNRQRVLVATESHERETYLLAVRRIDTFDVVDGDEHDLLITDDFRKAADAAEKKKRVLLLDPFKHLEQVVTDPALSGHLMPAQRWRHRPSIREVGRAARSRKLGVPGLMRIHDWDASGVLDESRVANQLDLVIWIFGSTPRQTCTGLRDDYLQLHVGLDGDGMALVDLDATLPANQRYYSLSLIGSEGAAYADDHHNTNLVFSDQGLTGLGFSEHESEIFHLVADFAASLSAEPEFTARWSDPRSALAIAKDCLSNSRADMLTLGGESE